MRCWASRCGFPGARARVDSDQRRQEPLPADRAPDYLDLARENRTFEAIIAEARLPLSMQTARRGRTGVEPAGVGQLPRDAAARGRSWPSPHRGGRRRAPSWRSSSASVSGKSGSAVAPIAGRTLPLNGRLFSIAGVDPEGFQGPGGLYEPDLWLPLERLDLLGLSPALTSRDEAWLSVAGRMKPGVTAAQAQADLRGIMTQLALAYPPTEHRPQRHLHPGERRRARASRHRACRVDRAGGRRDRAADRVLQRGRPAAGARLGAAARNRRAGRARRQPGPDPAAARDRRRAPRGHQRRSRADPLGVERRPALRVQSPLPHPAAPAHRLRSPSALGSR